MTSTHSWLSVLGAHLLPLGWHRLRNPIYGETAKLAFTVAVARPVREVTIRVLRAGAEKDAGSRRPFDRTKPTRG